MFNNFCSETVATSTPEDYGLLFHCACPSSFLCQSAFSLTFTVHVCWVFFYALVFLPSKLHFLSGCCFSRFLRVPLCWFSPLLRFLVEGNSKSYRFPRIFPTTISHPSEATPLTTLRLFCLCCIFYHSLV